MNHADYYYTVRTDRIISAFCNPVDSDRVTEYAHRWISGETPPRILGYPSEIDEDDIDTEFLTGKLVTEDDIGLEVWYVTDGHHRAYAALEAGMRYIDAEIDPSTFADEQDLIEYRKAMSRT